MGRPPVALPPPLHAHMAAEVLSDFGHNLGLAIDRSGGRLPEQLAYEHLPLPLADRVLPGSMLTLGKLLDDFYPQFELRMDRPSGVLCVMRHPNPSPNIGKKPVCRYWDPLKLAGCRKGCECDFKHELVPGRPPY